MPEETPVVLPDGFEAADYEHWARAKKWSEGESTALALGFEPLDTPQVQNLLYRVKDFGSTSEKVFCRRIEKMMRLIDRHFGNPHFYVSIAPRELLAWMRNQKLWVPDGMAEAIEEFDIPVIDWQARAQDAEQNHAAMARRVAELETAISDGAINASSATRERESLMKLVIGMAVEQYGFDPEASRNNAAANIASDLLLHGLTLSDDTIRKYLREAADLLPPQQDE